MKKTLLVLSAFFIVSTAFSQVAYMHYRLVPQENQEEFEELETKYWSKVAQSAIDKGQLVSWTLWKKIGVTHRDHPNYVFTLIYENVEQAMNSNAFWDNIDALGVDMSLVETMSMSTHTFDYWVQLEDFVDGDYKYALVNYAKPDDFAAFIEENRVIWKPIHEQNITNGVNGMTSWGLASVIYPQGKLGRFSCLTWDGFNNMVDAMNYLRYDASWEGDGPLADAISKSRMDEIMIDGFEYRILYERVMTVE